MFVVLELGMYIFDKGASHLKFALKTLRIMKMLTENIKRVIKIYKSKITKHTKARTHSQGKIDGKMAKTICQETIDGSMTETICQEK